MVSDTLTWLTCAEAEQVIAAASGTGADPNAIERLRKHFPEFTSEQIGAAIHQSWLRARCASRWGVDTKFLMTADGLEQATRPAVSQFHASIATQLVGHNARVVDLTAGLGFDASHFAIAGHAVTAVERDPDVAFLATHNLMPFGISVVCEDATSWKIPEETDLVFVDPARRDPRAARSSLGQSARQLNPHDWSPNWNFLESVASRHQVMAKVAPGISDNFIEEWDTYFVSCDGDLVEALVVSNGTGNRMATLIRGSHVELVPGGSDTPATEIGDFLIVPDSALVRARALSWLADKCDGGLVHPKISWITSMNESKSVALASDPYKPASVFSILKKVPFDKKLLKREISSLPHSALTVMTRGLQIDVEQLRKTLVGNTTPSAPELVLAIFRGENAATALLCRRLS